MTYTKKQRKSQRQRQSKKGYFESGRMKGYYDPNASKQKESLMSRLKKIYGKKEVA